MEKSRPNFWSTSAIFKKTLIKVNSRLIGEKLPNLVTLVIRGEIDDFTV
jgi:hypothetical protein